MERVRRSLLSRRAIAAQWHSRAEGQGLIEYSLVLLFVSIALVSGLVTYQGGLSGKFGEILTALLPNA